MHNQIAEFIEANPNHHMVPVLRAMQSDGLNLQLITPDGKVIAVQPAATMVVLLDCQELGPTSFHESLGNLISEAACIIVNAGPPDARFCSLLVDGARKHGRSLLIETTVGQARAWLAYVDAKRRFECGVLAFAPPESIPEDMVPHKVSTVPTRH